MSDLTPERIWIDSFRHVGSYRACAGADAPSESNRSTEYVRADLHAALRAEVERLEGCIAPLDDHVMQVFNAVLEAGGFEGDNPDDFGPDDVATGTREDMEFCVANNMRGLRRVIVRAAAAEAERDRLRELLAECADDLSERNRLLGAVNLFVLHYPCGINPYLDLAYTAALTALQGSKNVDSQ